MREAAEEPGFHTSPYWGRSYPRIQLYAVAHLLNGKKPNVPLTRRTYEETTRITPRAEQQRTLFGANLVPFYKLTAVIWHCAIRTIYKFK
jgi:hypothetical protein